MTKVFSRRTLGQFEDASAAIPLRQIDRVFGGANIRIGEDPGGPAGTRRAQFRRYVAGVDQQDAQQRDRLGDALGKLVQAVAASKEDFLVKAAERDGFLLADGVFRPAENVPHSFAVTRVEDLALIDDRGRRLHLLANDSPNDAVGGAMELAESVCCTVLRLVGEPSPGKATDLVDVAKSTLRALERMPAGIDDAQKSTALVRTCLQHLAAVVVRLGELRNVDASDHGRSAEWRSPSPREARLAVGAAVTFAGFVAESYGEKATLKSD